jgi:hypothetical protein
MMPLPEDKAEMGISVKKQMGISLRYLQCWVIDGRLVHGTRCECRPWDIALHRMNMEGAE